MLVECDRHRQETANSVGDLINVPSNTNLNVGPHKGTQENLVAGADRAIRDRADHRLGASFARKPSGWLDMGRRSGASGTNDQ